VAVDELPRAVDSAENLGDANPDVRRLRHLAKLYRRNLKPGPESQIGADALVQYIEPRYTVWVKCVGVIEKTARDRLRARHHVALRTEERRIALVRDQRTSKAPFPLTNASAALARSAKNASKSLRSALPIFVSFGGFAFARLVVARQTHSRALDWVISMRRARRNRRRRCAPSPLG
jgi:hypothetical protein